MAGTSARHMPPWQATADVPDGSGGGGAADKLHVLAVGYAHRAELASALAAAAECMLEHVAPPAEAARRLAQAERQPDVIVLVQSRPGEIAQQQVDALRRAAPLARFVGLLGPWCEGELRTGRAWPGVLRVYWHAWPLRWEADRACLAAGRLPSWAQPETATEDDRALSLAPAALPAGRVAVWARDRSTAEWLHDACLALGQSPVYAAPEGDEPLEADAAIWDCPGVLCENEDALRRWVARVRPAQVIVLAGFPRWHDALAALAAQAACLASKPLRLDELAAAIRLARAARGRLK
ncbi:MAG: hypothetical protein K6T86_20390 [Pirellulales bacterium]|nr:hypothetical protein [Pirellulales bacterium]